MTFELLVATRYLRARRKQTVISVITLIAILGVGAGVAALVVALAVSEGQRQDIQTRLFEAQAHVTVYPTGRKGISNYLEVAKEIEQVDGVLGAAPHAEQPAVLKTRDNLAFGIVNGILPETEARVSQLSKAVKSGQLTDFTGNKIAVGQQLAENLGLKIGDQVTLFSGSSSAGALGLTPNYARFEIAAIYSIGLFEYDSQLIYMPFDRAAHLIGIDDAATNIVVKVRDINRSEEVGKAILERIGPGYVFEDWKVRNKPILGALKLERLGMTIAIGLIVFVAALNIVAMLTMMVLEKTRDIAALMAMGATVAQIRRVFELQGVIIGVIGTLLGLVLGHILSFVADKYQLIQLDPNVYSISHLPFRADLSDSLIIAAAAIFISFLATLYPSAAAARVQPVEALRYE